MGVVATARLLRGVAVGRIRPKSQRRRHAKRCRRARPTRSTAIVEEGEKPFAMLEDLWIKHRDWVFEPLYYSSLDKLVGALDKEIIGPAEMRFDELVVRKAEMMKGKHV